MSIAVTVHIGTSPTVRAALAGFALLNAALACGMATNWLGPFHLHTLLLLVHAGAALAFAVCAVQRPTPRRIDISGPGQITVTVQQELQEAPATPVRLLPGCTFLPGLMVLELADETGARTVLAVLPDAITGGQFRRFAAALRSIAARGEICVERSKIF
ncbi:MAG TPA: hypothetical protein VFT37_07475 [Telluria sp.]|nr:hypothetical protein [Telluria sp.]